MIEANSFNSVMKRSIVGLLALTLLASAGGFPLYGESLSGPEVIQKVEKAPVPETLNAILTMKLVNSQGEEKVRQLEAWKRGNDSSVMVFRKPEGIAGIALLKGADREGKEKTWLYLPSLDMTKEMDQESENRNFMSSDFSYEDLGSRDVDEYTYSLLRVEDSDDGTVYVIEGKAKDPEKAGYGVIKSWINGKHWKPEKVEYYDREGELIKVQRNSSIEKVDGYWVVKEMAMENKQKGSRTVLTWKEYRIDTELPENIFDPEALPELNEEE
jgi:outer membrane lipoprotein-sorting protein